jgi:hypothetical protein
LQVVLFLRGNHLTYQAFLNGNHQPQIPTGNAFLQVLSYTVLEEQLPHAPAVAGKNESAGVMASCGFPVRDASHSLSDAAAGLAFADISASGVCNTKSTCL